MAASDKIQEAKNCFNDIKESGRNNYQKYSYFETKDIFPIIREICKKFKLKTQFNKEMWYEQPVMKLTITDQEDESKEEFVVSIPEINTNDPGKYMQDVGRVQTYAMRYLYIQAFEIAVPDEIDNKDQTKMGNKPLKNNAKKVAIKNTPGPTTATAPGNEVAAINLTEINKVLDQTYNNIVVKGGKEFTETAALWQLQRMCKDNTLLFEACKKNLKMYTANKVGIV